VNKSKIKGLTIAGILIVVLMLLSVGYDLFYNAGRIVYPMDASAYVFQLSDLPLLASILLLLIYICVVIIILFKANLNRQKALPAQNKTRKISPKLGYLGFLGFLGFAGIWTYQIDASIFPFCFFVFFGFFSFFLEGKMSDTLIDERFQQNAQAAQLKALKIGFTIIFLAVIIVSQGRFIHNLDMIAIILTITLSLDIALTLFLCEYFLYRLDHDEQLSE